VQKRRGVRGCLGRHWLDGSMLDCFRLCLHRPLCVIVIEPRQLFIDLSFTFDPVELAISLILRVPWVKFRVSVPEYKGAADVVGLEVNAILVVEGCQIGRRRVDRVRWDGPSARICKFLVRVVKPVVLPKSEEDGHVAINVAMIRSVRAVRGTGQPRLTNDAVRR
jgi:hypothetical protein